MVKIPRMEKSVSIEGFAERYFGKNELEEIRRRGNKAQSYAASFAAKEAFGKALGTGIRGFSLCEVELLHRDSGAPYLRLSGNAARIAEEKLKEYSVSITHEGEYACAVVVGIEAPRNRAKNYDRADRESCCGR